MDGMSCSNNKPYGQKQVVMDWMSCLQTIIHVVKKLTVLFTNNRSRV